MFRARTITADRATSTCRRAAGTSRPWDRKSACSRRRAGVSDTAIRTTGFEDLYLALGDQRGQGRWTVRAYVNPLAPFIWFGGAFMALGGFASLWARLRRRRGGARCRHGAGRMRRSLRILLLAAWRRWARRPCSRRLRPIPACRSDRGPERPGASVRSGAGSARGRLAEEIPLSGLPGRVARRIQCAARRRSAPADPRAHSGRRQRSADQGLSGRRATATSS